MTTSLYIQCIAMALFGLMFQISCIAIPKMKRKASAANKEFSLAQWWSCDWHIVIATLAVIAMLTIGLDQLLNWKPEIMEYVKWFFALIGSVGSNIAMSFLSKYESKIMALLDIKANVSDTVTGGTSTVQDTIDKGTEATGKDIAIKMDNMK